MDIITLDHGSGGRKTARLIEEILLPSLSNEVLNVLGDGAILNMNGPLAFSTDSFVIDPVFFPGGNIGKLAVCGTVNDLSMCGAKPRYLSLGLILEEGFPIDDLKKIVASIAAEAAACGVQVVTGDTKVVEKGKGDGIYINTSGIGEMVYSGLGTHQLQEGDAVIISGPIGNHGAAIMLARSGLMESGLESDCRALNDLAHAVLACGGVRVMRDPTRGGVATTLNEWVEDTQLTIELDEEMLPIDAPVRAACDALGLDPLYCANEGKFLLAVQADKADDVLSALHALPGGEGAAQIGTISSRYPGKVILKNPAGGARILQKLTGAQLPRIC